VETLRVETLRRWETNGSDASAETTLVLVPRDFVLVRQFGVGHMRKYEVNQNPVPIGERYGSVYDEDPRMFLQRNVAVRSSRTEARNGFGRRNAKRYQAAETTQRVDENGKKATAAVMQCSCGRGEFFEGY
jgi:hypothetical protein